ncbi:MAG: phosphodiester glycosidase family protein [Spirochaetaceae bacterium]|nr:phosphodiester glycosidase family protein [Spirochaetaceae bacterium]
MKTKKLSPYIFIFSLFLALPLTSCASQRIIDADAEPILYPAETYIPESFDWQEVQPGISRFDFSNPDFPIIYHAVRIDLTTPGLELVCTPDAPENRSRRVATSKFAAEQNCVVAINATQFDSKEIIGIHKANGTVLAEPVEKYAAIAFRREQNGEQGYSAVIFSEQKAPLFQEYDYAFGGFFVVLKDSEIIYDYIRRHTSRSGAGLSADGRVLYLLVAEGEHPLKSEGLSYPQCGEIFKAMGCTDALEFDGGSSSELCINSKSVLSYKPYITQASSFGFRLPSPAQE